ncbi:Hsp20/alpha crystallin family protein [Sporocytophaga myxococcoides]|uniref:Hsp20/alpha crystallin family protein n=1 Tax=Sporocytophaga myxococcoides TaxID=153721 RepID=UPI0018CE6CDE|nr:Hsp20/alpha crystallin family protein [Sporocytophaga myxococcoides]
MALIFLGKNEWHIFFLLSIKSKMEKIMTLLVKENREKDFTPKSFSDFIDSFFNEASAVQSNQAKYFSPKADILEADKEFQIQLALPGLKKEEIKVDFHDKRLTVSGERKAEFKEQGKKVHALGTAYGQFHRSFVLPDEIAHENIQAEFKDGILFITIPKAEKIEKKSVIEVK